jgi:hypothetical protein
MFCWPCYCYAPINVKPQRWGLGICGVLEHLIFWANFQSNAPPSGNKYWSNIPPFCNKLQ